MLKRLFLMVLCVVTALSPVVVFAEDTEPSSENTGVSLINDGAICDVSTLGVAEDGDSVRLRAKWNPKIYNCEVGYYLKTNAESADCALCPANSYCAGFSDYVYNENETDYGRTACPSGYHTDAEGSTQKQDCYKTETKTCAVKNPYTVSHATQVLYSNESTTCTEHFGGEAVCDLSCDVSGLVCEAGFEPHEEDGVWTCIDIAINCDAGTYLPKDSTECVICPANNYCGGGRYNASDSEDQGIETCKNNLKSPEGTSSDKDCGVVLHIDGDILYLHADKRGTGPWLAVKDSKGRVWYANTTPVGEGRINAQPVSDGATKELHMMVDGVEYTVHTTLYQ